MEKRGAWSRVECRAWHRVEGACSAGSARVNELSKFSKMFSSPFSLNLLTNMDNWISNADGHFLSFMLLMRRILCLQMVMMES